MYDSIVREIIDHLYKIDTDASTFSKQCDYSISTLNGEIRSVQRANEKYAFHENDIDESFIVEEIENLEENIEVVKKLRDSVKTIKKKIVKKSKNNTNLDSILNYYHNEMGENNTIYSSIVQFLNENTVKHKKEKIIVRVTQMINILKNEHKTKFRKILNESIEKAETINKKLNGVKSLIYNNPYISKKPKLRNKIMSNYNNISKTIKDYMETFNINLTRLEREVYISCDELPNINKIIDNTNIIYDRYGNFTPREIIHNEMNIIKQEALIHSKLAQTYIQSSSLINKLDSLIEHLKREKSLYKGFTAKDIFTEHRDYIIEGANHLLYNLTQLKRHSLEMMERLNKSKTLTQEDIDTVNNFTSDVAPLKIKTNKLVASNKTTYFTDNNRKNYRPLMHPDHFLGRNNIRNKI